MQAMAVKIVRALLAADAAVDTTDRTERLFALITPLIKDVPNADDDTDEDVRPASFVGSMGCSLMSLLLLSCMVQAAFPAAESG